MDLWGTDLAGGILLEEPYQTRAYTESRPPVAVDDHLLNYRQQSPRPFNRGLSLQTMPTLNPQDAYAAAMLGDDAFDTQKIAANGTLKRMKMPRPETQFTPIRPPLDGLPLLQGPLQNAGSGKTVDMKKNFFVDFLCF